MLPFWTFVTHPLGLLQIRQPFVICEKLVPTPKQFLPRSLSKISNDAVDSSSPILSLCQKGTGPGHPMCIF